jgi:hypothetical protein
MPSQKKPDQSSERVNLFAVCDDRIRVNLHTGRVVEATIKAVINRTDEGPTQGDREVPVNITCPHCTHPNELDWPIGAVYSVTPDDGT